MKSYSNMTVAMKHFAGMLVIILFTVRTAHAYINEVWEDGGRYHWKISNTYQGSSAELAAAINSCVWQSSGAGREIHILAGGDLSETIGVPPDVSLFGHGNTFNATHGGYGVHARGVSNISFSDMKITGAFYMGFRITGCNDVALSGIHIDGGYMGMRIESSDSNHPWDFRSYNLTVVNCTFENTGGHAFETYSIENIYMDEMVARYAGGCGVILNNSSNAFVGTVDAYRCCYGGGYAGLRFANGCRDIRVQYLRAIECGRGFFTVSGAWDIVVEEVYIRDCSSHAILIQNSDGVGVNSGTHDGFVINHYTSVNCWILASDATGVTDPSPAAPTGLVASAGVSGVSLNWSAVSGAASYRLQRSTTSGGPFFTIAYTETTSCADRDIAADTTYYYRVRAVNAAGPGPASSEASAAVSGSFMPSVDLAAGLQKHFRFDGSTADSQGGSSADISGTETYAPGVENQAISFDGSTYATLDQLFGGDYRDFTVAAWIWPNSTANWQRIFDFGNGTGNYMMLTLSGGGLHFHICQDSLVQSVVTAAPTLERWAHVAVTFRGNWATVYINGTALKKVLFSNNPTHLNLFSNYLGKSQWPDPLYSGLMDDVRLYDRGLIGEEITELYMSMPPVAPTDLEGVGFGPKAILDWVGLNAISYNIKRATVSGGPYTTIAAGVTDTTYTDTNVSTDTTYYYVVSASNAQGEGDNSNQTVVLTGDLAAQVKFDEGKGIAATDSSPNGWDVTFHNDPNWISGVYGNAISFSSASFQHGTFPSGVVRGLNDFTICTWLKIDSFADWARVFDFGTGTDNYMFLCSQYAGSTGMIRFAIRTPSVPQQVINSSVPVQLNTGTHVAITLSGTTGRMYLNGNLVGTNTAMTLDPADLGITTKNYLGRSQFAADPYLDGALDDFRIYAKALSVSEIATVKNGGNISGIGDTTPPIPNPVGWAARPNVSGNGTVRMQATSCLDSNGVEYYFACSYGGGHDSGWQDSELYEDTGLTVGKTYTYTVRARDKSINQNTTFTSVPASCVAMTITGPVYWNFDDGTDGQPFTPSGQPNGSGGAVDLISGVLMRGWDATAGPSFSSETLTGSGLSAYCNGQDGYTTDAALNAWSPQTWTIEVSVNLLNVSGWRTLIGRDGSSWGQAPSDFYLQNNAIDNKFRIDINTVGGRRWLLDGDYIIQANKWYRLAVTSDGVTLKMFLDPGSGYEQIGSLDISAQSVADNALAATNYNWTFGRGWHNGAFVDHIIGYLDDIRFTEATLSPEQFLGALSKPISWLYGDFTGNHYVNYDDFAIFSQLWLLNDCDSLRDFDTDGDCVIGLPELSQMANKWLSAN